jgi:hypothetical protein
MCGYMVVSITREWSRWHVLIIHVLGWCWLPCMRIFLILYPIKQIMFIYLSCKHIHCMYFYSDAPLCISTYAPASYRIANRESSHRTRGVERAARSAAIGGARGQRGGRWGASGVPRSPPEFLRERQAPEHFSLGLQIFN